ncbi:MAG: Crp/Fnr family transcriptional regulator [Cyanobacteria bacterium SIG31]|nr:Crp/Fnr family transcriptional regulator [Cyanobacteria bacterium SIG31]
MEKYYTQIKNSPVFFGLSEDELKEMLACFNARVKIFEDGERVIRQGDVVKNIYLVLDGAVNIEKDSYWGRRIIISQLGINDNIALAFVASKNVESSIDAVAVGKAKLLILTYEKCTTMCQNVCTKHKNLINNLFEILSKENIELLQKIENISQKTIREKLLTYLSNEARRNKSNIFEIPFNRQDLADYLNIDRSAMSFELSKMQKDGLIKFEKNKFMLKHI